MRSKSQPRRGLRVGLATDNTGQPPHQLGEVTPTTGIGVRRLFAKYGLVVRTGERTVLIVTDPAHAAIGWGSSGNPVTKFFVPACPRPIKTLYASPSWRL